MLTEQEYRAKFAMLIEIIKDPTPISNKLQFEVANINPDLDQDQIHLKYSKYEPILDQGLNLINWVRFRYSWLDETTNKLCYHGYFIVPIFDVVTNTFRGLSLDLSNVSDYAQPLQIEDFSRLFAAIQNNENFASNIIELILDRHFVSEELRLPNNLNNLYHLSLQRMTPYHYVLVNGVRARFSSVKRMPAPNLSILPSLRILSMRQTWFDKGPNLKATQLQHLFCGDCGQEIPAELPATLIGLHIFDPYNSDDYYQENVDLTLPDVSSKTLPNLRGLFFSGLSEVFNVPIKLDKTRLTFATRVILSRLQRQDFFIGFREQGKTMRDLGLNSPPGVFAEALLNQTLTVEILDAHFNAMIAGFLSMRRREPELKQKHVGDFLRLYKKFTIEKLSQDLSRGIFDYLLPAVTLEETMYKNAVSMQNMLSDSSDVGCKEVLDNYIKKNLPVLINNAKQQHHFLCDAVPSLENMRQKQEANSVKASRMISTIGN